MGGDDLPTYAEATCVEVPMEGLNPLIGLAAFQVNQEKEMLEAALNAISIDYEGANKYKVRDPSGKAVYFVAEESGCCCRICCSPSHTMKLHVTDMTGENVLTMDRPWAYNCNICCCLTCELGNMCGCSHMDVYMGRDVSEENMIGSIRMPCCGGGFTPKLNITDRKGETRAVVKGPCCCISDMCGANFEVESRDGKTIGDVKKLGVQSAAGFAQEALTDADNFMISFPKDMNVEYKALLMGTLLLLDYMFFEDEGAFEFNPFQCVCKFKCCDCFCLGCICPCSCNCPATKEAEEKGAPAAPDLIPMAIEAPAPDRDAYGVIVGEPVARRL